ncbi:LamB/YcsF family protein [Halomonas getboli]|uniref:LamB/YcsF family protein n=1 Tax=Halomonas getboli TaxID=2935862 RepID=UPI001FFF810D|nr:5-oxoprolinase subunit PxpA [Halomonas getboli]MCK2184734.1 LamB/YcsF family protein [Halomonas getboli]
MSHIDLNSDLGESFGQWRMGDDDAMLDLVTSANVACGFHAGDPAGMARTLAAAAERGVSVGAHVSYPDLVGFGRRHMELAHHELRADVIYQIGALQGMAGAAGTAVRYVKPHGALYHAIAHDRRQAEAVIEAIQTLDASLVLMTLAGSPLNDWAREAGLATAAEAFADRAYHRDGRLVSRREAGAVLHDPEQVAERMLRLVQHGTLESVEGDVVAVDAASICVHGDSPGAIAMAQAVRQRLLDAGVNLRAFAHGGPDASQESA